MDFGGEFLYTSWPVKSGARVITTVELTARYIQRTESFGSKMFRYYEPNSMVLSLRVTIYEQPLAVIEPCARVTTMYKSISNY